MLGMRIRTGTPTLAGGAPPAGGAATRVGVGVGGAGGAAVVAVGATGGCTTGAVVGVRVAVGGTTGGWTTGGAVACGGVVAVGVTIPPVPADGAADGPPGAALGIGEAVRVAPAGLAAEDGAGDAGAAVVAVIAAVDGATAAAVPLVAAAVGIAMAMAVGVGTLLATLVGVADSGEDRSAKTSAPIKTSALATNATRGRKRRFPKRAITFLPRL